MTLLPSVHLCVQVLLSRENKTEGVELAMIFLIIHAI